MVPGYDLFLYFIISVNRNITVYNIIEIPFAHLDLTFIYNFLYNWCPCENVKPTFLNQLLLNTQRHCDFSPLLIDIASRDYELLWMNHTYYCE